MLSGPAARRSAPGARRAALVVGAFAAAALLAGCSGGAPTAQSGNAGGRGSISVNPTTPAKAASLVLAPADQAVDVAPGDPVTVTAVEGKISQVVLTNAEGTAVAGQVSADGKSWTSSEALGYAKAYSLTASAQGADGRPATSQSSFTTVKPGRQISISMNPPDGQTVGIGQPLAFYFSAAITDKAAAEKAIKVTTTPAANGGFYWFSDREVHWRPEVYWKAGTQITVDAAIYGKRLGTGWFGREDRKAAITIGNAVIAVADGSTHQMTVEVNGQLVNTLPISMGKKGHETPNGTYVLMTNQQDYTMDSSTYGVPADAPGGYRTKIAFASRMSNSGVFYHSAPWSVRQQGSSNVSHGCINMSTENAAWLQSITNKGDIFAVQNSGGPDLQAWDGFGDWQIPWATWQLGGKK